MSMLETPYQSPVINDYIFALQQRNLVYNHDFRYFSNQIPNGNLIEYGIPDGWQYKDEGTDGYIKFDPSTYQLEIMKSSGAKNMNFKQAIHEFPRWQQMLLGERITAQIEGRLISGELHVTLSDGINSDTISQTEKGDFEIEGQIKVNAQAESVNIILHSNVAFTHFKLTNICVNVGNVVIKGLPCIVQGIIGERRQYIATETPPAEELSLCEAPIELSNDYTRLNSVLQGRFGVGPNKNSMLLDMRGYFSRVWNNGADIDPDASDRTPPGTGTISGDHVSTFEKDVFHKHDHGLTFSVSPALKTGGNGAATQVVSTTNSKTEIEAAGKETRPKNIAELYTIKWA